VKAGKEQKWREKNSGKVTVIVALQNIYKFVTGCSKKKKLKQVI